MIGRAGPISRQVATNRTASATTPTNVSCGKGSPARKISALYSNH